MARARERLSGHSHVRVEHRQIPADWPDGPFDLIVVSELAYYLGEADLVRLLASMQETLAPGGVLVGVHWRGPTDYPISGDEAQRRLAGGGPWSSVAHYEEPSFLLDVWRRR